MIEWTTKDMILFQSPKGTANFPFKYLKSRISFAMMKKEMNNLVR